MPSDQPKLLKRVGIAQAGANNQIALDQEGRLSCTCGGTAIWWPDRSMPVLSGGTCSHLISLLGRGEVRWRNEMGLTYPVWVWANPASGVIACIPDVFVTDPARAMGNALKATLKYAGTGGFSDEDWDQLAALVIQRLHADGFTVTDRRKEREARDADTPEGYSPRRTRLIDLED